MPLLLGKMRFTVYLHIDLMKKVGIFNFIQPHFYKIHDPYLAAFLQIAVAFRLPAAFLLLLSYPVLCI